MPRSSALLLLLLAASCKTPERTSTTTTTSAQSDAGATTLVAPPPAPEPPPKMFVPSHAPTLFKGRFPHPAQPAADVTGRVASVVLAKKLEDGPDDVAPLFAITNTTNQRIAVDQTWIYSYDKDGKLLDEYPHSLGRSLELAPGETKTHRLGRTVTELKKGTVSLEVEVSSARLGADQSWKNENLVDFSRKQGGPSLQELADRAGERVIVDVYALGGKKVRLTNVSDRAVKELNLFYFYGDAKGEVDWQSVYFQHLTPALAPGQSVDFTPKQTKPEPTPKKAVAVVAFATRVEFADGPTFENKNLSERNHWVGLPRPK